MEQENEDALTGDLTPELTIWVN